MARWLLLLYRMPRTPSARRVAVWRALKRLKGGYVQDGVFVLGFSALHADILSDLAHDIRNYGGEATVALCTVDDDEGLRVRMNPERPPPAARAPRRRARRPRANRRDRQRR